MSNGVVIVSCKHESYKNVISLKFTLTGVKHVQFISIDFKVGEAENKIESTDVLEVFIIH